MLRGWTAGLAAARRGYRASTALSAPAPEAVRRRRARLAGAGLAAYAVAMIAGWPARLIVDPGPGWSVGGTLWHGEALLADRAGGAWRLEWRWSPGRTLAALAFAADVRLTGADTDLSGTATAWSGHRAFTDVAGVADGALVAALLPASPLACEGALQVGFRRLLLAGPDSAAVGEVRGDALRCTLAGTPETIALPPIIARATPLAGGTRIDAAPLDRPRLRLLDGGIAGGRLRLGATPVGLALLPAARALAVDRAL